MTIAEKITRAKTDYDEVYEAGKQAGGNTEEAFEEGKQAAYDAFWDTYQDSGNRTNGNGMFMGVGWNNETMKPKHGMVVKDAYMMFAYCGYTGDLDDLFDNRGLPLVWNLSYSSAQGYFFYSSNISAIGTVDLSPITETNKVASAFNSSTIITIRNLIPPKCAMSATCWGVGLRNLGIGGEITNNMNLSRCTSLSKASFENVIDNLTDGVTVTFSKTAKNKAFTDDEWNALVATKPNCTIALA